MPATKRGIFRDLKESSYTVSNKEIVFFFSSKFYMNKFLIEYRGKRKELKEKLSNGDYEDGLNHDTLADVYLYIEIEKRGFYACLKGVDISCEELHRYALARMIEPNTPDWFAIPSPKLAEREKTTV